MTRRILNPAAIAAALAMAACTSTVVRTNTPRLPPVASASTVKQGATATVQRGDTLYGIAFRNGVDVRDLAAWNGIGPPFTIYPGQVLRLHPRKAPASETRPRTASPVTPRPSPRPPAVASAPDGTPAVKRPSPVRPPATEPQPDAPPSASHIQWRWPADGQLLNRFVAGEPTRQGIDIGGESGAPVRAAADGVVVYSGAGLVGYGELIIVKHDDAWLSAYGHNRSRMVNEGALVKAGQQIAVMGRTGAPRDMLHFEIRHNGKPVDPLGQLPKR